MKGLLVKDIMILKGQAKSLLLVLICGLFMSFTFEPTTVIAYLTIVAAMTASGTIGYDEFDHGYSFLFTLPFQRKTYVHEKYVLAIGFGMLCTLIGSGASALIILFRGGTEKTADILPTAFMMIMMIMLLMSVMIPLRVKYNSEKGKTIQFIIYGALLLGVFGIGALLEKMGIDAGGAMEFFFTSVSPYALFAGMLVICLCILFVSVRISERIIEKKEY